MLADIGVGLIIPIYVSKIFGIDLSFSLIIWGVIFCLLPDFDFVLALFFKIKDHHNHREISHFPLYYLLAGIIVYFIFGKIWATMYILGVMWHFIHDSIGIGWGIQWLYPFSSHHIKFFSNEKNEMGLKHYFRTGSELDELKRLHHKPDWIRHYYFRPTFVSISETSIFILGVILILLELL